MNTGCWDEARQQLNNIQQLKQAPEYWILNATVYHVQNLPAHEWMCISIGLSHDPYNYELYYMLGNYYLAKNADQAFLCYEQALFYCNDENDTTFINSEMNALKQSGSISVRPVSFVILSYDSMDIMKLCIESIRTTCPPKAYELVVVDNASTDGICEWLELQPDIRLIKNTENSGFAKGCNQGITTAAQNNDIFLLNNDTILPANVLFWLRIGLYERKNIGAVGPLTNYASNYQMVSLENKNTDFQSYMEFARQILTPTQHSYENKYWLVGFAMLIKREVLNLVGLLDEGFQYGNYEDNDYGVRITKAGFELLLVHNSFIYHFGNVSMNKNPEKYAESLSINRQYFIQKHGFTPEYYSHIRTELIGLMQAESEDAIQVLEIGCGCGDTLSHIKYLYPNARVYGIELVEDVADCAAYMADVLVGNVETMALPYEEHQFDYMIMGDVLEHLRDPEAVIKKVKKYLKPQGRIIASIPNLMHISVILPLLQGNFTYQDEGLLDRTHIHFFTLNEIKQMFSRRSFTIEKISITYNPSLESNLDQELVNAVYSLPNIADKKQFQAYQYLIVAQNGI